MLTPEEIFIRDLEDYLYSEYEFNDKTRAKICRLLLEYKETVSVKIKIVNKNFYVYKTNNGLSSYPKTDKHILDLNGLQNEFNLFCKQKDIVYLNKKKRGRSTKEITQLRIDFCNYVSENFVVSKSDLANFFGLNHATIHYYFNPKYKEKKNEE